MIHQSEGFPVNPPVTAPPSHRGGADSPQPSRLVKATIIRRSTQVHLADPPPSTSNPHPSNPRPIPPADINNAEHFPNEGTYFYTSIFSPPFLSLNTPDECVNQGPGVKIPSLMAHPVEGKGHGGERERRVVLGEILRFPPPFPRRRSPSASRRARISITRPDGIINRC